MKHFAKLMALVCLAYSTAPVAAQDFTVDFEIGDFSLTPVFNRLTDFSFSIDIDEALVAGGVYNDPNLNSVQYQVRGVLDDDTPSGFPAFNLVRNIGGAEFYTQGSSLSFEVSGSADLSDGLQANELVADGVGRIFLFNGREVDTGRYHPAFIEFFDDGTGQIQNSNNTGGDNPFDDTDDDIDVDFGEEYIVDLNFDTSLTLAAAVAVPEPSTACLLGLGLVAGFARRRRRLA